MIKCPRCHKELVEVDRRRYLPDPEFSEMSDEQLIDFFAEEITGNYEKWGADEIFLRCTKCDTTYSWKENKYEPTREG